MNFHRPIEAIVVAFVMLWCSPAGTQALFETHRATDLPGFDFSRIDGIDIGQCEATCGAIDQCRAFTHNTVRSVCFLKSGFSKVDQFRGAISGIKTVKQSASGHVNDDFDLLADTDLPGDDYRGGGDDPQLKGISLSSCQNICAAESRCLSFTYNSQKAVCFLKEGNGTPKPFTGAISGIKRALGVMQAELGQDIRWKENEPPADFIARIRAAGESFGASCNTDRTAIEALAASATIETGKRDVLAGESISIRWKVPVPASRFPAYLLIFADQPVRFAGSGFYALMPGSRAPFGIKTHEDKTRAVIPLTGADAAGSGEMLLHLLNAGRHNVGWVTVGYDRSCKDEVEGAITIKQIDVRPGVPVIAVDDPFALTKPKQVILSPSGQRQIREFADRFQLVETERMSILGEFAGTFPRFSPTGRFITYKRSDFIEDGEYVGVPNIIDVVDGSLTGRGISSPAAWANGDSFVVGDAGGYGIADVVNPLLLEGDISRYNKISCFACSAWESVGLRIDLENNIVAFATQSEPRAFLHIKSLTGSTSIAHDMWNEDIRSEKEVLDRFRRDMQISSFRRPQVWELEGGLKLSMPELDREFDGHPSTLNHDRYYLRPKLQTEAVHADAAFGKAGGVVRAAATEWRGVARVPITEEVLGTYVSKLEAFGFDFAPRRTPRVLYDSATPLPSDENKQAAVRNDLLQIDTRLKSTIRLTGDRCDSFETRDWNTEERLTFKVADITGYGVWNIDDDRFSFVQITCQESARAALPWNEFFVIRPENKEPLTKLSFEGSQFQLYDSGELLGIAQTEIRVANIARPSEVSKVTVRTRNSLVTDIRLTSDRMHIVQMNSDGSFFVLRIADDRQVLEGRYLDDEIVVWSPDMHFDATLEGAHYVSLRFPGTPGQYTFEQFGDRMRVPGLVKQTLAGSGSQGGALAVGLPPRLSVDITKVLPDQIFAKVSIDSASVMKEIRVFQDGLLTDTIPVTAALLPTLPLDLARLTGARWLSIVGIDNNGLTSLPVGADLGGLSKVLPVLHTLAVGIDRYDDSRIQNLAFAAEDAKTWTESISASDGKTINMVSPEMLTDAEASASAILAAAERLVTEAKPGDTVAFFFAGHGLAGSDGQFYMATSGATLDRLEETALPWTDLSKVLAKSHARVLVFLDACHSGVAGTDFFASNDAAVDTLADGPTGVVVLSASKGRQLSEEHPAAGGGLFTNAVADVVARERTDYDLNGNGAIEVSELYAGVKRLVMKHSAGRQTPWLARNRMVGDFSLF